MVDLSALFEPFEYGGFTLGNRIVMSPMTRYFSPGGLPGPDVAAYYERRARGGAGLIITEGAFIDRPAARNVDNVPDIHAGTVGDWRTIVEQVHRAGGKIAPQLWHTGAQPDFNFPEQADRYALEGPSGLRGPDLASGTIMSDADIEAAIEAFARSCRAAADAGFDAVEFHGAHGYLFDQFFWDATNRRDDRWGGATLAERSRFAAEVVRAGRAALPDHIPIIFRLSQWKVYAYEAQLAANPGELEAWLGPLVDAGVDIFDCSQRRFWEAEFAGSDLNLAGWTKRVTGRPTITVGSIGLGTDLMTDFETGAVSAPAPASIIEAADRLARGEFDLIAVGRAMLADPDWANKVKSWRFDELSGYSVAMMSTLA